MSNENRRKEKTYELSLTAQQRAFIESMLNNQSGSFGDLKRVWALAEQLEISDEQKQEAGWHETAEGELTKVDNVNVVFSFTLTQANARYLRRLALVESTGWANVPPVRALLVSLDEQLPE